MAVKGWNFSSRFPPLLGKKTATQQWCFSVAQLQLLVTATVCVGQRSNQKALSRHNNKGALRDWFAATWTLVLSLHEQQYIGEDTDSNVLLDELFWFHSDGVSPYKVLRRDEDLGCDNFMTIIWTAIGLWQWSSRLGNTRWWPPPSAMQQTATLVVKLWTMEEW